MSRRRVLGVVRGGTLVVHAESVKPPGGWVVDAPRADALALQVAALPHFGDTRALVTAKAFRAPDPHRAALYVTRLEGNIPVIARDVAATAELAEVRGSMRRAGAAPDVSTQRVDPATKLIEGEVTWGDPGTGIVTTSRIVIAGDAQRLVAVLGECVMPGDAAPAIVTACKGALASLDPDLPVTARVEIAIVDVLAGVDPAAIAAAAAHGSARSSDAPRLDASGPRTTLPPMTIPQDRETDRRPIYIGGGIVILAILFYWNRQRREKFEREDAVTDAEVDADGDDLHAAAESAGEPDEPEKKAKS
ncbi:MAG: hypothetical protein WKG01_12970 [Kofleriaceae bacterium]